MAITVTIELYGSYATYEVKHEIDGIYKAILASKPFHLSHQFPKQIILIRSGGDSWASDYPSKIIGLKIGQKIVEQERSY